MSGALGQTRLPSSSAMNPTQPLSASRYAKQTSSPVAARYRLPEPAQSDRRAALQRIGIMAGTRQSHAAAGQDRHLPAHLIMCMLLPGRRMIEMLTLDSPLAGWQKTGTTQTQTQTQTHSSSRRDLTLAVLDIDIRIAF